MVRATTPRGNLLPLALLIGLLIPGCAYMWFTREDVLPLVETARARVLNERADLDEASREMVRTNNPTVGYYRAAGNYAQYDVKWLISSNRVVELYGEGNIKGKLEDAKILVSKRPSGY